MHITPDRGRLAAWIALPLAVVTSGIVVATASYASFSAQTDNGQNSWASGKVELSDDDSGTALFDAAGLAPGQHDAKCISVSSTSTVDSTVAMYTTGGTTNDLSSALAMTVQIADAGTACDDVSEPPAFSGTLSDLMAKTQHGDGIATWDTGTTSSSKVVKIGYELPADATNAAQDLTASTTFVWEAISK